ncbi:MAG: rhodanese-related sulfurtransferase [Cyclobacteriaceae bacterium]
MAVLHNRVNNDLLRRKIAASTEERVTLSFYKYHQFTDVQAFRDELYKAWQELGVLGRTFVASEGINAQISVPAVNWEAFKAHLYAYPIFEGLRLNLAIENNPKSFFRLRVAVRKKILSDGLNDAAFDVTNSGKHLNAAAFNALAQRGDAVIVDMRNHYESEVGHFIGAIRPDVDNFRESLPIVENLLKGKEEQPVLMYCTGGIRCEKASAWFRHRGFKEVYQLEGGIIEYARQVRSQGLENRFVGKNFVFDERLSEKITEDVISHCHQCGAPCDSHTNCRNQGCHLLFIQCPSCAEKYAGCCSESCREIAALPEAEQKALRKGKAQERKVFRKSRASHLRAPEQV